MRQVRPKKTQGSMASVTVEKRWFTITEAQKYLGFGNRDTQQEWRDAGRLPFFQVGRTILYDKADLDRFVQKHRVIQINHLNR